MNDELAEKIETQMFRYYDLDFCIQSMQFVKEENGFSHYALTGLNDDFEFYIDLLVKFRLINDKIIDFYVHDGKNYIEPTTTLEQQETR